MLRFLVLAVIAYLLFRLARWMMIEIKRYFPSKPQVHSSSSFQSSNNQIDYTKVQDADFEDLREGKDQPK